MVSIIIPYYNASATIGRALRSIVKQSAFLYSSILYEIIITDDGSNENETDKLKGLKKDYSFKLITSLENRGPSHARNQAIKNANGEFIAFLDADDEWPLDKINSQLLHIEKYNLDISGGRIKYLFEHIDREKIDLDNQDTMTHIHLGALLIRGKVFESDTLFDEELRFSEDWDWWLRMIEKKYRIAISERVCLLYYRHPNNMTRHASLEDFNWLKVFHKSLKRRKSQMVLPQVNDFRTEIAKPLISIICPISKGLKSLKQIISKIQYQSYNEIELVLIHNESLGIVEKQTKNITFPVIHIHRGSTSKVNALNLGIRACNGSFVVFTDKNDDWNKDKLKLQLEELIKNPYYGFITINQEVKVDPNYQYRTSFCKKQSKGTIESYDINSILFRKHVLLSINAFETSSDSINSMNIIDKLRSRHVGEGHLNKKLQYKWLNNNESEVSHK